MTKETGFFTRIKGDSPVIRKNPTKETGFLPGLKVIVQLFVKTRFLTLLDNSSFLPSSFFLLPSSFFLLPSSFFLRLMIDREWWTQQWLDLINTYRFKKRLERGWQYAREGKVLS
ncbi:MAG: hypothetical protein WCD53_29800, partial [Microcoleus sp.]